MNLSITNNEFTLLIGEVSKTNEIMKCICSFIYEPEGIPLGITMKRKIVCNNSVMET